YSGFGLCNTLRITTSMAEDPFHNMLAFDFAGMRARLDRDRLDAVKQTELSDSEVCGELESDHAEVTEGNTQQVIHPPRVSLIELLSTNTQIGRVPVTDK